MTKTPMRKFVLLLVLGLGFLGAQAQTPATTTTKIGFVDVDEIFSQMPEQKQVESELKALQTQLKTNIDNRYQEFQKKLNEYNSTDPNSVPAAVRANSERELQQLQTNLEKLQQDAQTNLQAKQTELMNPIIDKVGSAIESVAKENGYTFILSAQIGGLDVVLYGDEKVNVSDLVLKKLGITPAAKSSENKPK